MLQVAYTPNGGLMISLGADGAVCAFDSHANYAISHRLPGQSVSGQPPCLCVSADSATLALTVPDIKADKVQCCCDFTQCCVSRWHMIPSVHNDVCDTQQS